MVCNHGAEATDAVVCEALMESEPEWLVAKDALVYVLEYLVYRGCSLRDEKEENHIRYQGAGMSPNQRPSW